MGFRVATMRPVVLVTQVCHPDALIKIVSLLLDAAGLALFSLCFDLRLFNLILLLIFLFMRLLLFPFLLKVESISAI